MSRIEEVMRELSDLRDFYLKIQKRHQKDGPAASVSENSVGYNQGKDSESLVSHPKRLLPGNQG